jgi:CheY-like chemotaxis protein
MAETTRLILADDDLDDCLMFREALSEISFRATLNVFNDGDSLLRSLYANETGKPGAIFLDLNMPMKSGFECLEEIKGSDKLKSIPVFIFSTSVPDHLAATLQKKGAAGCFQKPSEYQKLKNIIQRVLQDLQSGGSFSKS